MAEDDLPPIDDDEPEQPKAARTRVKPTGSPKGSHVAQVKAKATSRLSGLLMTETSPALCKEAVRWSAEGYALLVGSTEKIYESDSDVEAMGESLHRLNKMLPATKVLVNMAPPLMFFGAGAHLVHRIHAACPPGTLGYRWAHRNDQAAEGWQPQVVPNLFEQTG